MILFLALLARAGHGKSTAAKHLISKYNAKVISLATPLKNCAKAAMGFSDAQLWGTQSEKEAIDPRYGISCRTFLQKLGTEGMRKEFGENFFLDAVVNSSVRGANGAYRHSGVFIVDDARFINEVRYLNALGTSTGLEHTRGAVIKILCTDAPPMEGDDATKNHASEREIDMVPDSELAATVVSSRAQGVVHLVGEIEKAIDASPRLYMLRSRRAA